MWCEVRVYIQSLMYGNLTVPAAFAEKKILCPLNWLVILVENQLSINVWASLGTLSSIPLINTLRSIAHNIDYHCL